jgi:hypothetical protein
MPGLMYRLNEYYNRNLEEVVDIPIGAANKVEPGPADQAQPTRFFPGRYYGVFAVAVPKDKPKAEVSWTVNAHGQALSIPAIIDPLYFISPQKEDGGLYLVIRRQSVLRASGQPAQGPWGDSKSIGASRVRWRSTCGSPTTVCRPCRAGAVRSRLPTATAGRKVIRELERLPRTWQRQLRNRRRRSRRKAHTTTTFSKPGSKFCACSRVTHDPERCAAGRWHLRVTVDAGQATTSQGRKMSGDRIHR